MRVQLKALPLSAFLAAAALVGWAAIQRSPEEIEKESDLIATVRVLAAACVDADVSKEVKEYRYHAWLQVLKPVKGTKAGATVLVGWTEWSETLLGATPDPFLPGEEVNARLHWDDAGRTYKSIPGAGRARRLKPSKYKGLDREAGKVFLPK